MKDFKQEEIYNYPGTIVATILWRIRKPQEALKNSAEIERRLEHASSLNEEDPSQYYTLDSKNKLGTDGIGSKLFHMVRNAD